MVRYCSRCGAVLEQGDVFCKSCGSKQEAASFPAADGVKRADGAAADSPDTNQNANTNKNITRKKKTAAIVLIITAVVVLIGIFAAFVIVKLPSKAERIAGIVNIYCFDEYYTSDMEVSRGEKLVIKVSRARSDFLDSKVDGYTASSLDYSFYSDEIPEDVRSTMFEEIDGELLSSRGIKELCCYRVEINEGTSGGFCVNFIFGCDIKKPEQAPVPLGILYQPFDGNGELLTDDCMYVMYNDPNGTINVLYQWLEYLRDFYKAKGEMEFNERTSFLLFALNEMVGLSGDGDAADALEDELDETGSAYGQQNGCYGDSGDLEAFWDRVEGIWINLDSCKRWGTDSADISFELCQFGDMHLAFAAYPGEWSRAGEIVKALETSPGKYTVTLYYAEEEFMDYYYPEEYSEIEVEIQYDRLWTSADPGVVWSYMGNDWDGAIQAAADYCDKISA